MKIKTIEASGSNEYQDAYSMLKRWRGLRYVAEITEFEDEKQCTIDLQKKVDEMLMFTRQPSRFDGEEMQGYEPLKVTNSYQPQKPISSIDYKAKEKLEIDIENATSPEELHRIYEDAEKYGLTEQWKDKMVLLPFPFPPPNTD